MKWIQYHFKQISNLFLLVDFKLNSLVPGGSGWLLKMYFSNLYHSVSSDNTLKWLPQPSQWYGGGWGCEVSCGGHHRQRGKTTTGSALDGAVLDFTLAYLVHNRSRSQLYLEEMDHTVPSPERPLNLITHSLSNSMLASVQVLTWCCETTNTYQNQCWYPAISCYMASLAAFVYSVH